MDATGSGGQESSGQFIVACVDLSAAAGWVLDNAVALSHATGRPIEVVHVRSAQGTSVEGIEELAARHGLEVRFLDPPPGAALLSRLAARDVGGAVIGTGADRSGPRPVGPVARQVIEHCRRPVLVVPPDGASPPKLRRVVLPLEGSAAATEAVASTVRPFLGPGVEPVVVHVFTEATVPAMLDRPVRDMAMLEDAFLAKHLPDAIHIEMSWGAVATKVLELCRTHSADLIALSWSQATAPGRARVVMGVLEAADVPVLLVPA